MAHYSYHNEGYTRGGLDVVTGVNLFFKGILLFPIFVLAGFVGLTLLKYLVFNGIPSMNAPTEQQREAIRERDQASQPAESFTIPPIPSLPAQKPSVEPYSVPVNEAPRVAMASNCPEGHPMRNRLGANGLPWVCPTATPVWNTEILEDPFQ